MSLTVEATDLLDSSRAPMASSILDAERVVVVSPRARSIVLRDAAALGPAFFAAAVGLEGRFDVSSSRRASRSAFFRACSAFFCSASSFLLVPDFAPSCQSATSAAAAWVSASACLASAAAAFWQRKRD